jgi:hypothetical protein
MVSFCDVTVSVIYSFFFIPSLSSNLRCALCEIHISIIIFLYCLYFQTFIINSSSSACNSCFINDFKLEGV